MPKKAAAALAHATALGIELDIAEYAATAIAGKGIPWIADLDTTDQHSTAVREIALCQSVITQMGIQQQ